MGRFKSPIVAAIASAGLTASLVGGVAIAQTSTNAEIIACVAENSGNVRIVASADDCKPNEASTRWNQQGPPGPQGPQGLPGTPATASISNLLGAVGSHPANSTFRLVGPRARITTTDGQKVVASISAIIGSSGSGPVDFIPCYAPPGGSAILFNSANYLTHSLQANIDETISSALSATPAAGTYDVGLCVRNSTIPLDRADWVNGTITVFN